MFKKSGHVVEIMENTKVPAKVLDLNELLSSQELNPTFEISGDSFGMFQVDSKTGTGVFICPSPNLQIFLYLGYLMLLSPPDRETRDQYNIKIVGKVASNDNGREVPILFYTVIVNENGQKRPAGKDCKKLVSIGTLRHDFSEEELSVKVLIMDENDNKPEFLTFENPLRLSISSDKQVGDMVAKIEAWDADAGSNGEIRYFLSGQSDHFRIDHVTGDIRVNLGLENFGGQSMAIRVEARDLRGSTKGQHSTMDIIVRKELNFHPYLLIKVNHFITRFTWSTPITS